MNQAHHHDPFAGLKGDAEGYKVFDERYESVGRVDDLFVDESDSPLYIGVRTGLLGTRSTPVPVEIVRVNDKRRVVEIAESSEQIKHAPSFEENEELTPELEEKVRVYFGLRAPQTFADRGPHGPADHATGRDPAPEGRVDLIPGERKTSEPPSTPPPSPAATSGSTDTEPGKEWARGTEGHKPEERERVGGHRTKARRLRR